MLNHVNIEEDQITVPDFAIHSDKEIKGFFGQYSFLSNYFPCPNGIYYQGIKFPSTENAYQSAKFSKVFLTKFQNISANESKKLANKLMADLKSGYNFDTWQDQKFEIMYGLVFQKFNNDLNFRDLLIATHNKYLEETNSWGDVVWGKFNNEGENRLGQLLMQIRKILR